MNDSTWSGGDQATSYRASNGLTYWAFGDTVTGEQDPVTGGYQQGWQMLPNTILRQDGAVFTSAVRGAAVPNALNGDRYWPMGIFEGNGFLYVFCQRVRNTDTFFQLRGVELAKFAFEPDGRLNLVGMVRTPSTWALAGDSASTAQYGADAVHEGGFAGVVVGCRLCTAGRQLDLCARAYGPWLSRLARHDAGSADAALEGRWCKSNPEVMAMIYVILVMMLVYVVAYHAPPHYPGGGTARVAS